ncbi:MAG: HAD family phosphatase [Betaproteobacteria bacterium]
MLSAILWDNDGVLVDTERYYYQANRDYLRRHGIELSEKQFLDWYLNNNCGAWHILTDRGTSPAQIEAMRHERNVLHLELLASATELLTPGIDTLLESLAGRVEMGIVTSATRASFESIHSRLDILRHFRFALTCETYTHSKPSPEPYLLGIERIGRPAEECLVVEDSPRGLQAAHAAGLRCIVLRSALTHGHDFAGAWRVVDTLAELQSEIEALLNEA